MTHASNTDIRKLTGLLPALYIIGSAGALFWRPLSRRFKLTAVKNRINQVKLGTSYEDVRKMVERWPFVKTYERSSRELVVELRSPGKTARGFKSGHFHDWSFRFDQEQKLVDIKLESGVWHARV